MLLLVSTRPNPTSYDATRGVCFWFACARSMRLLCCFTASEEESIRRWSALVDACPRNNAQCGRCCACYYKRHLLSLSSWQGEICTPTPRAVLTAV